MVVALCGIADTALHAGQAIGNLTASVVDMGDLKVNTTAVLASAQNGSRLHKNVVEFAVEQPSPFGDGCSNVRVRLSLTAHLDRPSKCATPT